MDDAERAAQGMTVRREVLGDEHVDRAVAGTTPLTAPFQDWELAMHLRAALRNGLTPDQIGEVLLHTAVYAGVPAANRAFAIAREVLAEAP
jgi:alkylhydroperoxidase/carboxymuconolactone decarboxylase family protein YurZ